MHNSTGLADNGSLRVKLSVTGAGVEQTACGTANNLYARGYFTRAGGVPASCIANWDGSYWSALGSGMDFYAYALAVSGSDLYAGGNFTTVGGKVSGYIVRAIPGDAPVYNQLKGPLGPGGAMHFSYVGYPTTNYLLDRVSSLALGPIGHTQLGAGEVLPRTLEP